MKYWKKPTDDLVRKALSSVKKEVDRQYFFSKLQNPLWLKFLQNEGVFSTPPKTRFLPNGNIQFPHWPELQYLNNICKEYPSEVVKVLLDLRDVDNPRVYEGIMAIALRIEPKYSIELLPKIVECIKLRYQFLSHRYSPLLNQWVAAGESEAALSLVIELISMFTIPGIDLRNQNYKLIERNKEVDVLGFDCNQYQDILRDGVIPLMKERLLPCTEILLNAMCSLLRYENPMLDDSVQILNDHSQIWCPRLKDEDEYDSTNSSLVHTLTYACEQVFLNKLDAIALLDIQLRSQPWLLFLRLRQHLYARFSTEQTKPWIREMLLSYGHYADHEYHYEFQEMIRCSCETFGGALLTEEERTRIFDEILEGPSKQEFKEWLGERYTEKNFEKRMNRFHLAQLRPFESVLFANYKCKYDSLCAIATETLTDESYYPYTREKSGVVTYESPRSEEDLAKQSDDELLGYINSWEAAHRAPNDWLKEINISALARKFEEVIKNYVLPNQTRREFWFKNVLLIERPIYVRTLAQSLQSLIERCDFSLLDPTLSLCRWILDRPNERTVDDARKSHESKINPDWDSSRHAVSDLIETFIRQEISAPISAREDIAALLKTLCTQPDYRLDKKESIFLNPYDPISEAINNTRSRSLEVLIHFGFWVRKHLPQDPLPEVEDVFKMRFAPDSMPQLTVPELALLGMNFGRLFQLKPDWATENRSAIFRKDSQDFWSAAFSSFLKYNQPFVPVFEVIRGDLEFALEHLVQRIDDKELERDWTDTLGQHLFTYYLWGRDPLDAPYCLLKCFYKKTEKYPKRWERLFDHVGISVKNSGANLDVSLKGRVLAFVDWRFQQRNATELSSFSFWLEAECLDADWRLDAFLQILDIAPGEEIEIHSNITALNKLLSGYHNKVVACFAKLISRIARCDFDFIPVDEAKPIVNLGLLSADESVRKQAEDTRENLLRAGRFEFLDA